MGQSGKAGLKKIEKKKGHHCPERDGREGK
jgi:hypothetical protein